MTGVSKDEDKVIEFLMGKEYYERKPLRVIHHALGHPTSHGLVLSKRCVLQLMQVAWRYFHSCGHFHSIISSILITSPVLLGKRDLRYPQAKPNISISFWSSHQYWLTSPCVAKGMDGI